MKCGSLLVVVVCALAVLSGPVQAQVSFFQPPTYTDCSTGFFSNLFVADFNGDGKPDLLCFDGTLNLGNGDGTFKLGMPVSMNSSQGIAAVADFNGDGKPDLLETGSSGTLLVLLGNGDGTFQSAISSPGVIFPPLAAVDLNGDGKADVVGIYTGNPNGSLNVCISNGDGTFKACVPYSLGSGGYDSAVSAGDFNGDGKLDIAVYTGSQVLVFLGNGDGTLQAPKSSVGPTYNTFTYNLFSTVAGDFNGDGKLDLAIGAWCGGTQACGTGPLYTLLGNGDGTFQAPQSSISSGPFVVLDVNGDGKVDLVSAGTATVAQIYLGNGDGTFSASRSYVATLSTASLYTVTTIAAGDFNSDGKSDIATAGGVLLGNGDGTFQGIPVSSGLFADIIGDFEKNGKPDIAVAYAGATSTTLDVSHNNGDGTFSLIHTYSTPESAIVVGDTSLVTGDVNGDGNLDLVVIGENATSNEFEYSVLLGNGDGSFQAPISYTPGLLGVGEGGAAIADLNNDRKLDLLMLGTSLVVLLGNGDGTFAAPATYYPGGSNPGGSAPLLIGDFNGDGKVDVAISNVSLSGGTDVLYGNGDGTLQSAIVPPSLSGFAAFSAAGLRNDDKVDLVGYSTSGSGEVALNNGDGTFTILPLTYNPVAVADVNGDGRPDLFTLLASNQPCPIGVQLGNGNGTFGSPINLGCIPYPGLIADMNADGRPDLVYNWPGGIVVVFNTTPPSLELSATAPTPSPVTAGSSATSTVTAVPIFGFNGTETLSCTGLPNGAGCLFNPATINGSSKSSTLTITTSASIAAGTYPVQIQGTAGSTMNSVVASLVVQAAPDFSIAAASGSSTSQTVTAGQTASFSLAFAPLGSFTGTINLSCAVTPVVTPAPTCSLSTGSVQITGTGTQTVKVKVGTTASITSGAVSHLTFPTGPMSLAWLLMFLGSAWLWTRDRKRLSALSAPIVVLAFLFSMGCGGSGSSSHTTPAVTYTATVTGTSGSTSHNIALQVIVQ